MRSFSRKNYFVFSLILITSSFLFSQSFEVNGWINYDFEDPTDLIQGRLVSPLMGGNFIASGGFKRDNYVIPPYADILHNNYWFWNEGYYSYESNLFNLDIGLKQNSAGPGNIYKLFVDDNSDFSYPTLNIIAQGAQGKVKVENLWGGLRLYEYENHPIKSLNYRAIVISPFEGLEIAYEESILYLDRYFDPFYFFAPLPLPAVQESFHMSTAPWYSEFDDNSLIGGWIKYTMKDSNIYFEILIDDINMNRFLRPDDPHQNPDKLAFLAGFSTKKGFFNIFFEVAGATAFTFQRTHDEIPYEYVIFESSDLPLENNMIGYEHGENNLATGVRLEYNKNKWFAQIDYEFLIHGTRDVDQPWYGDEMPNSTQWLTGELETVHSLTFLLEHRFQNISTLIEELILGVKFGAIDHKPFIGTTFSTSFL